MKKRFLNYNYDSITNCCKGNVSVTIGQVTGVGAVVTTWCKPRESFGGRAERQVYLMLYSSKKGERASEALAHGVL